MPLIDKKPFVRQKPPPDLKPDEELFYCKLTHEVFREYEEFFERVILCNSLVWTCSLTGKPGLTYQEALDSEKRALRLLNKFPDGLKIPVLYLATLTQRGRLNDMCDDVFMFVKDHFFVGETVEVVVDGAKRNCEVTKVLVPEKEPKSPEKTEVNGNLKAKKKVKSVFPTKVKYEVQDKEKNLTIVKAQGVSRVKGSYTRERNKLFLKQNSTVKDGVWKVKDDVIKKAGLENFKFSDIFVGTEPSFQKSPTKKKTSNTSERKENSGKKNLNGKLNFKPESAEERKNADNKDLNPADWKSIAEKAEMMRKRAEEEKEKIKEQKLKEKEKRKEEKRLLSELMKEWKKDRDDLECDDLKNLPGATPIDCSIPQEIFGDAVMVLEFLSSFEEQLHVKDSFPHGFTFEHLEKALVESDIQGPLNDLLECLLSSLFQLRDEVDEEEEEDDEENKISAFEGSDTTAQAVALASAASSWPMLYHGTILRKMPLDSFSITEILRLHMLASGASKGRNLIQGQNGLPDDPGLWFKVEEPELLKKLATVSVFQLTPGERIRILNLLVNQLLSCSVIRDIIEENNAKLGPMIMELKHLRWAYARKLKEGALSKKKKQEDKGKEREQQPVNGEQNLVNGEQNHVDGEQNHVHGEQSPMNGEGDLVNGTCDAPNGEQIDEGKEDVENLTPEQQRELEEKRLKEAARQRQEFLRKEKEMVAKVQKIQSLTNIKPLGRDRAYRRFWVFQTLPGIFVEDDDPSVGNCLPKGTPLVSTSVFNREDAPISLVRKHLQQINDNINGSSDKENDVKLSLTVIQSDSSSPLKVRRLSDLNSKVDLKQMPLETLMHSAHEEQPCLICSEKSDVNDSTIKQCSHSKVSSPPFGICTGNIDTCSVHNVNSANRVKWSFFHKQEDLDALIATLNPRGFRERNLRDVLVREKDFILESVSKCHSYTLNKTLPPPLLPEVRKSQRLQNTLKPSDFAEMEPEEALELTLRDMILELEHRIYEGGLGSIKVQDHEAWRTAIEGRSYEMQCDQLEWGTAKDKVVHNKKINGECTEDSVSSRSSSPVLNQPIKDLSCALLQVSQGIEPRFLHPPLGEDDAFKKIKQKALERIAAWENRRKNKESEEGGGGEMGPCPKVPRSPLVRWQESLMESSSLSQLFVHLGTLERSVAWSRSVLKAHCRICRRRGDAENMLLCDGCNRGHHLYCLKPPLTSIPEDDWFCLSCKPPEKVTTPKKRKYVSDSEDEMSDEESEYQESDEELDDEEDEDNEEEEDNESAVCSSCGDGVGRGRGGSLIHCSDCKITYHLRCTELSQLPTEKWQCTPCARKRRRRGSPLSSRLHREVTSKQSSSGSKVKIGGKKRARSDSTESDYVPSKRACRDSAANSERRRIYRFGEDSLDYKSCLDLLVELIRHPSSWPFLVPVNKKDAPDYHQVIKRPMDLGTIRTKLNNMSYRSNNDFVLDVYLVLQNCELFNPKSSPEYKAARTLGKVVERLLDSYQIYNPFDSKNKGSQKEANVRQ